MSRQSSFNRCERSANLCLLAVTLVLALAAAPVSAGTVLIAQGSNVSIGSGEIDLGCADVEIAGGLSGPLSGARDVTISPGAAPAAAVIGLSGYWINNGPQELDVAIDWRDGCSVYEASMLGSSTVPALTIQSSSGREIRLDASGEQRVANSLSLTGTPGELLRLRPTASAQFARLTLGLGASQLIDSVDVAYIDSDAGQDIAPGMPADYNSLRSGPVRNWFMLPAVPVSTLGLAATGLLILLMILIGLFHQRRYTQQASE